MAKGKIRYTIDLDAEIAQKADDFFESIGSTRKNGVEKSLLWLIEQNEIMQGIVLGTVPKALRHEAFRIMLKELESQFMDAEAEEFDAHIRPSSNLSIASSTNSLEQPKRKAAKVKKKRLGTPKE